MKSRPGDRHPPYQSGSSFWGYRRVWAYLRYMEQQTVTQKRVYRLMKLHDLLVQPNLRLKARLMAQPPETKAHSPQSLVGN